MTKTRILAITLIFMLILTGIRLVWIYSTWLGDHPLAEQGVLDLRDTSWSRPILLEGEWTFYPEHFLLRENADSPRPGGRIHILPASWQGQFADPKQVTGYGSYRLLIRLGDAGERELALAMPSSVTASELYVDGVKLGNAGKPGATPGDTAAFDGTYLVPFFTDRSEVEIVVHVANFDNAVMGGLVAPIQFGAEDVIWTYRNFSIAMQRLVCVFLLIHVLYAIVLYFVGLRQRAVFTLALMMACACLSVLVTDDKLLVASLNLPYAISLKLGTLSYLWVGALLIVFVQQLYPALHKRPWHVYYGLLTLLLTVAVVLLPASYVSWIDLYSTPFLIAGFVYAPILLLRAALRLDRDAIFLWLGFVSLATNLIWGIINAFSNGLRLVYFYPLDLIVVFAAFATYWFRLYFRNLQQTVQLAAELQKADKQKNDFLANTSHELRNPLHGMINIAHSVLGEQHLPPASQEKLELLVTVGKRMSLLLNDLMDFDRLQAKGLRLEPRAVQAQAAVSGVLDMLRYVTEGKPIALRNELPDTFPPVWADENRLVQILFNLVHNAIKFTSEGHVVIRGFVRGQSAVLEVEDTGIGIEPELQQRIFQPYEQADSSMTAIGGGIGLGLSISRQLAELHGGSLEVESEPGRGSTFRITLPLASGAAQAVEPGAAMAAVDLAAAGPAGGPGSPVEAVKAGRPSAGASASASAGWSADAELVAETGDNSRAKLPRVLIVDDDPVNLRILEGLLPRRQYQVTTVQSGPEAISLIDKSEWDLVVADVMMPRMSGYELTQTIRMRFSMSELPVLLLTARSRPEDISAGFRAGANDYVTKPADSLELQHRVRALTELKMTATEQKRMETALLQSQVQPHFLLNTLNSIAALSEIDTERMRVLLEVFGKYLKASFDFRNSERVVPLEQELVLVKAYLFIERERFSDRVNVEWDIPYHLLSTPVPPLSIQALVENAVRSGILKRIKGGTVRIAARDLGDSVEIQVADDGLGMDEQTLQHIQDAADDTPGDLADIGLRNTERRLRQLYGRGLDIAAVPGEGTTITFRAGRR